MENLQEKTLQIIENAIKIKKLLDKIQELKEDIKKEMEEQKKLAEENNGISHIHNILELSTLLHINNQKDKTTTYEELQKNLQQLTGLPEPKAQEILTNSLKELLKKGEIYSPKEGTYTVI